MRRLILLLGKILIPAVLVSFVVSCGTIIPKEKNEKHYYVIADNGTTPEFKVAPSAKKILVREAIGNPFINSHRIIFARDTSSRGFYQFAQWVETPTKRITFLLIERLERARIFESASRIGSSVRGDLQLNLELLDFYHDISSSPGKAKVRIKAEIINSRSRDIIDEEEFSREIKVKSFSAKGAVGGFTQAVNEILDEMVVWLSDT